jgi:hypothetical protein
MENHISLYDEKFITYNTLYTMYIFTLTETLEEQILKNKEHTKKNFEEFYNKTIKIFKIDLISNRLDIWLNDDELNAQKIKDSFEIYQMIIDILKEYKDEKFFSQIEKDLYSKEELNFELLILKLLKYLENNYNIKRLLIIDYTQKLSDFEIYLYNKIGHYINKLLNLYFYLIRIILSFLLERKFNINKIHPFQIEEIKKECCERCNCMKKTKEELLRLQNIVEKRENELIEINNEILLFRNGKLEKEIEIENLKKEIEKNILIIKRKDQALKESEIDIKYKDDCIKDMELRLKTQKNNNKSDKNKLKKTIETLKNENEELLKKIAHYCEININLKNEITFLQKTIDSQKNEIQENKNKIENLNKTINDLYQYNYKLDVQIMEYENYLKLMS